jgi:hypothetical protein
MSRQLCRNRRHVGDERPKAAPLPFVFEVAGSMTGRNDEPDERVAIGFIELEYIAEALDEERGKPSARRT